MLMLLFQMVLILIVFFVMKQKSDLNVSIGFPQCALLITNRYLTSVGSSRFVFCLLLLFLFQMALILNVCFVMEQKSGLNVSIGFSQCALLMKSRYLNLVGISCFIFWFLTLILFPIVSISNVSLVMKAEEPFECFHWVSPMCFVDNKPLPDFSWYLPLRFLVPNVDLISNGFDFECFSRDESGRAV